MKIEEIKLMYEYNFWADQRILETAANVSAEQFDAPTSFGLGWPSLHATLVHNVDSQWSWRLGFEKFFVAVDPVTGIAPETPFKAWDIGELTVADLPTYAAVKERFQTEAQAMRAYLNGLTDHDLNGHVRYGIPGGIVRDRVLWYCLLHVINHSTQHRSEAAALLTSYGFSPGELDITGFLNIYFNLQAE